MQTKKSARSSIGQHFRVKHSSAPKDLSNTFSILKKCKSEFDCLVFEMCFITDWDLVSMYNQTHFVQKFLN